ncbi:MAG: amidohydrolase family protein [Pseudomonadota bacterium]
MSENTIVDVWAQITSERMQAAPWLATLNRWTDPESTRPLPTAESTVAAMDDAGVAISLLAAWHGPEGPLMTNAEVAKHLEAYPDRFRGLACADLHRPMEAVRELRDYVDGNSFVGVRVVPWLWDLPPNDRRYYPIYAACVDLGVPFCLQIGHTGPLMRSETGRPIPYLEDVLLDFPELKIVGGHVGFPWIDELISLTIKFPNFFVDTSAYAVHRLPESFVKYMKGLGSERVMFGTNWPMLSPQQCLRQLDRLGLSQQQEDAFLFENARRVFNLGV